MRQTRILVADDHALFRRAVGALLALESDFRVIAEAGSGKEALEQAAAHRPDVIIMDISMAELNGLDATERALSLFPGIRVIVVSMHTAEDYVLRALGAGAAGYVSKDCKQGELAASIRAAVAGSVYVSPPLLTPGVLDRLRDPASPTAPIDLLTTRQREILQLLAEGHCVKKTALRLGISAKTVETHRSRIMNALGIRDLAGLVRYAIRIGLVQPDR